MCIYILEAMLVSYTLNKGPLELFVLWDVKNWEAKLTDIGFVNL